MDLPTSPMAARAAHLVPESQSHSLLSIGQLCDAGCVATFAAAEVIAIRHNDAIILQGHRTRDTNLWHIALPNGAPAASANAAVGSATPSELVAFAHASLFSRTLSALSTALDTGHVPNFPGSSSRTLRNSPPRSAAMTKGHLDQTRKKLRSAKASVVLDTFPPSVGKGARSHHCCVSIFEPTGQIYADQTGKFVTPSITGNNCLLVSYDFDSNSILAEPMKSRHATAIPNACKAVHAKLCNAGLRPQLQRLNNECSSILKECMTAQNVKYQLVPPGVHRRNAAERALRTFKNHFIAELCSVDKDFPLHLWDRLLPQAILTSNLLRGSRLNPKLSAHAQMFGHFDCNRTPIAPPDVRVVVHKKSSKRATWSPHAIDGWCMGPALESHQCCTLWIAETCSLRICDTLS
jgi:hypothetical protein